MLRWLRFTCQCLIGVFALGITVVSQNRIVYPSEEEIAKNKRINELLKHPTFITLRLISERGRYPAEEPTTTPRPYTVDERVHFELFLTQNSTESFLFYNYKWPFYEYRPELNRDGDIVAYTDEAKSKVERAEGGPPDGSMAMIELIPGREYFNSFVRLEDWYETPLKPGRYQLLVRKQFVPAGEWVESNPVTFDVISPNASQPNSQDQVDLDALDQKLQRYLQVKMAGWSCERIQPIQGSKGVLLQSWSYENRGVRVAVTPLKSAEEAKKAMQNFPQVAREAQPLADVGDDAYVWGYDRRQIHFRRGRTIFDVEAGAQVDSGPDARNLTWSQRRTREKAEVKRLTREFAKHLVEAIDAP